MAPSSNHQEHKKVEEDTEKTQKDHRKLSASSSSLSKSSKRPQNHKKELQCKFCNKRFSNSQALGGHQNAHKEERAAAKRENILTMASAYRDTHSHSHSLSYLGFQPLLSMIHTPNQVQLRRQMMNVNPQPTMHQLQTLLAADRSRFHDQKTDLSAYRIRTPSSSSNAGLQLSLCENQNLLQASSSLVRLESNLCDSRRNSDQASPSLRIPWNDTEHELDLTLKL